MASLHFDKVPSCLAVLESKNCGENLLLSHKGPNVERLLDSLRALVQCLPQLAISWQRPATAAKREAKPPALERTRRQLLEEPLSEGEGRQ